VHFTRDALPVSDETLHSGFVRDKEGRMASPLVDYCEQVSPVLLERVQHQKRMFSPAERRQESLVARAERSALLWLAERTPAWMNSDHLTMLGFVAQLLAGAAYAWSRWTKFGLLAAVFALAMNWFGDSLDGTLARYRQQQRPRYGFYVDHMVDSFGALALMGGLAVSGYMHPYIAIGLLISFLLLSIQSYLATYTLGEFRLSFWKFGPTELRILLSAGNIALFLRGPFAHLAGKEFRLFDIGGLIGILGMAAMLVAVTIQNTCRLYGEEKIQ
jgi:archaetidylinositol phosphate synthase